MPNVSVIIPVYNAASFLRECVESIRGQDLEVEIILVDDCSVDGSYELCLELAKADPRIKVVRNEVNSFAGACRNIGTSLASGEYLLYLDADDKLEPGALAEFYRLAKAENLDVIRGTAMAFNHETGGIVRSRYYEQCEVCGAIARRPVDLLSAYREIVKLSPVPWLGLCRTALVKDAGLKFNSLRCSNDVSFFFDLMMVSRRIRFVRKRLVWHRVNNRSSLMGVRAKNYRCVLESLKIIASHIAPLPAPVRAAILERQFLSFPEWLEQALACADDRQAVINDFRTALATVDLPISGYKLMARKWYHKLSKHLGPLFVKDTERILWWKAEAYRIWWLLTRIGKALWR